jgi:hypothetical protein
MTKSLPPIHEIAAMSGVKLPDYLGTLQSDKSKKNEPSESAK